MGLHPLTLRPIAITSLALAAAAVSTGAGARTSGTPTRLHPAAAWPERVVMAESPTVTSQAIVGGLRYALVSLTHTPVRGPYLLERTELATGRVAKGPRFAYGNLTLAAGRLWIYGASARGGTAIEVSRARYGGSGRSPFRNHRRATTGSPSQLRLRVRCGSEHHAR